MSSRFLLVVVGERQLRVAVLSPPDFRHPWCHFDGSYVSICFGILCCSSIIIQIPKRSAACHISRED